MQRPCHAGWHSRPAPIPTVVGSGAWSAGLTLRQCSTASNAKNRMPQPQAMQSPKPPRFLANRTFSDAGGCQQPPAFLFPDHHAKGQELAWRVPSDILMPRCAKGSAGTGNPDKKKDARKRIVFGVLSHMSRPSG